MKKIKQQRGLEGKIRLKRQRKIKVKQKIEEFERIKTGRKIKNRKENSERKKWAKVRRTDCNNQEIN